MGVHRVCPSSSFSSSFHSRECCHLRTCCPTCYPNQHVSQCAWRAGTYRPCAYAESVAAAADHQRLRLFVQFAQRSVSVKMLPTHTMVILGPKTDCLTQEVELKVTSISEQIQLERPFQTVVRLQSHVDRQLGPLTLTTASGKSPPPSSWDWLHVCMHRTPGCVCVLNCNTASTGGASALCTLITSPSAGLTCKCSDLNNIASGGTAWHNPSCCGQAVL